MQQDTIYALATPHGRSGVAVIRVSGAAAGAGLMALSGRDDLPASHLGKLCTLRDPVRRETIDQAFVIYFENPRSYTGEDVVEYHLHGSRAVIEEMLGVLSALPHHRMAAPGEFTRRAFENGKMDLTAAEAVADLIDAQTIAQKSQALQQMGGALSSLYEDWTARLVKALAHAEADIEFPDEEIGEEVSPELISVVEGLSREISDHLDDNRRGERLRDGLHIAVIGAPNAGKSSLVNALAQRDVAIVSDIAGTTRDVIEAHLNLGGYPVILSDTAGLRPDQIGQEVQSDEIATGIEKQEARSDIVTTGIEKDAQSEIESEGIRRALERANSADLRLLVFDGTVEMDTHTLALIDENSLIVVNKADQDMSGIYTEYLQVSAKTEQGLDALLAEIIARIELMVGARETPSLTRARHREALGEAQGSLARALQAELPELMAEDMRLAIRSIGRITGRVDVEDLLDVIFNDFCIGK